MKGWLIAAALALLIGTACGSFWIGTRWQEGRDALAQVTAAHAAVGAAQAQLTEYDQKLRQSTIDFQDNADALRKIAQEYSDGNAQRQQFASALTTRLDRYLAAHPAVAACDLGPDGLRLWNDANRGAAASQPQRGSPGAKDRPVIAGGVPTAAAGIFRQIGRPAAQSRPDHWFVPGLPIAPLETGAGGARAPTAGDRAIDAGADIVERVHAALTKIDQGNP